MLLEISIIDLHCLLFRGIYERKNRSDQMTFTKEFPSVIKYMGSKTEVLDLIEAGFDYLDRPYKYVCALFAVSSTFSCALSN